MDIRIKKGHHFRSNHILTRFVFGKFMTSHYKVMFDESSIYNLPENKTQVNKLCGFGHLHHHINSMRIGWRWNNTEHKVELLKYMYKNGRREQSHICYVSLYQPIDIRMSYCIGDENIAMWLKIDKMICSDFIPVKTWWHRIPFIYECLSYFGGRQSAPHNIKIKVIRK